MSFPPRYPWSHGTLSPTYTAFQVVKSPKSMSAPPVWLGVCTALTPGSHATPQTSPSASGLAPLRGDMRAGQHGRATPCDPRGGRGLCPLRVEYRPWGWGAQWNAD